MEVGIVKEETDVGSLENMKFVVGLFFRNLLLKKTPPQTGLGIGPTGLSVRPSGLGSRPDIPV